MMPRHRKVNIVHVGTSLTAGYLIPSAESFYPQMTRVYLNIQDTILANLGVVSQITQSMIDNFAAQGGAYFVPGALNIAVIWPGPNDLIAVGLSAAQLKALVVTLVDLYKAAGYETILVDVLDRNYPPGDPTYTAKRNTYNASIVSDKCGAKRLTRISTNAAIGADGACNNTTYFNADGTHLKAAGAREVAIMVAVDINALCDSNVDYCGYPIGVGRTYTIYKPDVLGSLHRDTALTVPVTTLGQSAQGVDDLRSGLFPLTQATAADAPTYATLGGKTCLHFDGITQNLTSRLPTLRAPFAVGMAVRFGASATYQGVAEVGDYGGAGEAFFAALAPPSLHLYISPPAGGQVFSSFFATAGQWYTLIFSFGATAPYMTLYVDGAPVTIADLAAPMLITGKLTLGKIYAGYPTDLGLRKFLICDPLDAAGIARLHAELST